DLAGEFVSGDDRQRARLSRPCGPGRDPGEFRVDDAGGVDPYEHLAFPGMGLRRLLVGERLGATTCAQTDRLHIPPPGSCWPNARINWGDVAEAEHLMDAKDASAAPTDCSMSTPPERVH